MTTVTNSDTLSANGTPIRRNHRFSAFTPDSERLEVGRAHAFLRGGDTSAYIDIDAHGNVSLVCLRGDEPQHFTLALSRVDWPDAPPPCPACVAKGLDPDTQHAVRGARPAGPNYKGPRR